MNKESKKFGKNCLFRRIDKSLGWRIFVCERERGRVVLNIDVLFVVNNLGV